MKIVKLLLILVLCFVFAGSVFAATCGTIHAEMNACENIKNEPDCGNAFICGLVAENHVCWSCEWNTGRCIDRETVCTGGGCPDPATTCAESGGGSVPEFSTVGVGVATFVIGLVCGMFMQNKK
jgi:hypothetical protein